MSKQLDDPLRSPGHVSADSQQQHASPLSPSTAASQASPSAPFLNRDSSSAPISGPRLPSLSSRITSRQNGPRSSYYVGPPDKDSAFGTAPVGVIGRDKPREIVRIERDYSGGELCQFHPTFPLELEGRITPTAFSETINDINVIIIEANDSAWACLDNTLSVLSLYTSSFILGSKYRREMKRLERRMAEANRNSFNPVGLNLRSPVETAFLFIEVEYF
ncbi:hypothetical protein CBS101457_003671 [Exobasidium rhododendri]|nr:hypothetical protein CBS101457_003671 [Exobasidium rhododendri]